ncbi:putative phosphoglycerate mutase [Klugiella xanthotipulae]|uniref:Putative phosphoglycerate mutase n=1 Tax=Klugiella xanthotipulae TaxID=244735 RepID=A0A543I4B7_9MICO|nr:histidine phosphatase family protein [Klugiella xanthotipulae]TQM65439.1 putative phosphoglycerate mutase [Klugiella xanthotipulae]
MTPTTTIALIRHGQTPWNAEFRIQGRTDIPLNDTGRKQAQDAATTLGEGWHAIATSPLTRAAETARIIAAELGLDSPTAVEHLVERDYGRAEGLGAGEELESVRIPGGFQEAEPEVEVAARGLLALEHLRDTHPGHRVIAVAHGSFIRLTIASLFEFDAPRIGNASVTVLTHDESGWELQTVNGEPARGLAARTD